MLFFFFSFFVLAQAQVIQKQCFTWSSQWSAEPPKGITSLTTHLQKGTDHWFNAELNFHGIHFLALAAPFKINFKSLLEPKVPILRTVTAGGNG